MENVEIINVADQTVIGFRKQGSEEEITNAISKMFDYVMEQDDLDICGGPIFIQHMEDDNVELDLEVCFPLLYNPERTNVHNEFKIYELEGGEMAKLLHKGPRENFESSYDKLFDWIEENNYIMVGPPRDIQISPPEESPEDNLMEIHFPVEKIDASTLDDESDE